MKENLSNERSKLASKIEVYKDSKQTDEIMFISHPGRIELHMTVINESPPEGSPKRIPLRTTKLGLAHARRLRSMLDIHIKAFEK